MSISEWAVRKCLETAATKLCPNRFSISNGTADYYCVEIVDERGEFLVDTARLSGSQLPVMILAGDEFVDHADLDLSSISPGTIKVTHYHSHSSYAYTGAWIFLLGRWWGRLWLWLEEHSNQYIERRHQRQFDSTTLIVKGRLEVLDHLVKLYLENEDGSFTVASLISEMTGTSRWRSHPQSEELNRRYTRIVNSWVSEGCVGRRHGYEVLPLAISTLDNLQRDERRHSDMKNLNWWLVGLTGGLILTGLLQAWVTYTASTPP